MPRSNWNIISRFEVALPPINGEVITSFNDFTLSITTKLESNVFEMNTLASLRDTLLPKLISGELEVPSLEALGLESTS